MTDRGKLNGAGRAPLPTVRIERSLLPDASLFGLPQPIAPVASEPGPMRWLLFGWALGFACGVTAVAAAALLLATYR